MSRFNPRGGSAPAAGNKQVYDEFSGFDEFRDSNQNNEQEEWERYLIRMSPQDRSEREERPSRERGSFTPRNPKAGSPAEEPAPQRKTVRRRRVTFGAVVFLLLTMLSLAAALIYFGTDLYYVAGVEMKRVSVDLFVGEELTLDCKTISFGSGKPVMEWSSSEPEIAAVDAQGGVTALEAGRATVTVADPMSGRRAQCLVTVHNLNELILGAESLTMGAGETLRLTVQTATVTAEIPVFVSTDGAVAAADADGLVTAAQAGETDITVSCRGFSDAVCHVTVLESPTVMETVTDGAMCRGESRRFEITLGEGEYSASYTFSSADPQIVSVDENGVFTGVSEGTSAVTCTAYNGVSCTLPVTVGAEASSLTVPRKLTVYSGIPANLGAADDTGLCRGFYYSSSDPEVLEVDEQGSLRVLKRGTATVTCTTYNGLTARCEVTANIVDYTTPYNSQRVQENIAVLAATYPDIISVSSIGTSTQGRDITMLTLGTGERKVLVVAGMHSKEDIAVTYTMRCIDEYAKALSDGSRYGKYNIKKLLSEFTIFFVPLLNPDGLDIAQGLEQPLYTDQPLTAKEIDTYKNTATGVNLNRNFPFEWGYKGLNTTTADARTYVGSAPASEPETQAIIDLCAKHDFEWLLDMHCKGHLAYYQDKVTGETAEAKKLARRLYDRCGFTLTDKSTLKEISGGLENWFRKEYGKPGLCVELVPNKYNTEVNEHFDSKTVWKKTKYVFLMCLED